MRCTFLCYLIVFILFLPIQSEEEIITNPERGDGFGSQFQTIIYSVIYAELNNKTYVYTPFKNMEHNYDNDPHFITKKEWLINFLDNFKVNDNHAIAQSISPKHYIDFFESNLVACVSSASLKKIKVFLDQIKYGVIILMIQI